MFSFTKKQSVFNISGIKIGGQPGMYPTVLFGGLFFKGEPDFDNAKKQIQKMLYLSNKTGNPAIPDFFIKKEEYMITKPYETESKRIFLKEIIYFILS